MTRNRKDAALGFYLWGLVAMFVVSLSAEGLASWYGWLFFVASEVCLSLSLFASEAVLVRAVTDHWTPTRKRAD